MLCDEEYIRIQTVFLAIAKQSDQPRERARWFALVHACQEELLRKMRSKRLALAEGCVNQLQDFMIIAGSGFVVASVAIWLVWLSRRHRSIFLKYIRERPN